MTLDEVIRASGMTPIKVSERSGIKWSTLSRYRTGERNPLRMPAENFMRLAYSMHYTTEGLKQALEGVMEVRYMKLKEGWNDLSDDLSVFVEDGKILRGMIGNDLSQRTVYPYKKVSDGWNNVAPLPLEEAQRLANFKELAFL